MKVDRFQSAVEAAADIVRRADAILIGAGAGMGVDSGLPDFRGNRGFWRAYPLFERLGLSFTDLANPRWFHQDPAQAWGFYGHRYNLYRATEPHAGFALLRHWAAQKPAGGFVFTSNVDGHFQRAGFSEDNVLECHGSIHHLQCVDSCCDAIWSETLQLDVDLETLKARGDLPACPHCGGLARPNILMFGDFAWQPQRCDRQGARYSEWLSGLAGSGAELAVIEVGAGTAVPTVRYECEGRVRQLAGSLLRINPRDCDAPTGSVVLPMGAEAALVAIDQRLAGR